MKKRWIALTGLLLLATVACSAQVEGETETNTIDLYFSTPEYVVGGAAVVSESYTPSQEGDMVEELVERLLAGPMDTLSSESPFPMGVTLRSYTLEEEHLTIDLSERYGGLSGIDLTIADYCIALTLCQLEGVETVSITVEGEEIAFRSTQVLQADNIILTGAEEDPVYVNVALWFPRLAGDGLGVEPRELLLTEEDNLYEAVVEALVVGPSYSSLSPTVPEGTALNGVTVENGLCVVDFSQEFVAETDIDSGMAALMIYAITDTLCSLERTTVEVVQFQVDGIPVTYYGILDIAEGVAPNFELEK